MALFVGTSGYAYKEWKPSFYPADLPAKQMLRYYAEQFRSVEMNNSFYRLPTAASVEGWTQHVPAHFRFVLKAPQLITHVRRLNNAATALTDFCEVAAVLNDRLGPLFFQLPPNLKLDLPRLRDFLPLLPATVRTAWEFRHQSWFDDDVYALLRQHNAALCIADAGDDLEVPFVATADWGYLRLRRENYTTPGLKKWVKAVQDPPWADTFVFFKHEETGTGPKFARKFLELAE